jgi:vancomycin permeability regulator SanA
MDRRAWRAVSRARERAQASTARLWPRDIARGVALFFGGFSLLNVIAEVRVRGFDENVWWIDIRPLPALVRAAVFALAGIILVWWALRPGAARWRRIVTTICAAALAVLAIRNGITFYHVWHAGLIKPWMPLPLSFVLAAALLCVAVAAARSMPSRHSRLSAPLVVAVVIMCGILFPLAQQFFFGKTDYVQRAQVAIVMGAEVHVNGRPSMSLDDRVRTAARLYKAGLAQRLLMSGAQGRGEPVNETQAMRELAIGYGVPASAIEVDPNGFNTDATVRDTVPMLRAAGVRHVAVVSDFFHLPRVKLAFQRGGYDVITVPSHERQIPQIPGLVLREIPAFWVYYLRAVLR